MEEKGTISIHSENIFPIIKKALYSNNEIFLRELISNAVDATQKIKHLAEIGEYSGELGETKIKVAFDKEKKTITISDKGIGMTADEIKKYINQIAFSGATEFVEKYKDKEAARESIIGHFGLGFYSAYMVANRVEIFSKSFKDEAAAHWDCDGSTEYKLQDGDKKERGTDIVLHISEDGEEFLEKERLQHILNKYCRFLPIEIEFEGEVINDPHPLWTKAPADLKDQDYIDFYKQLYPTSPEPLFWIHLNVDFPFHLTGVLYFPKIQSDLELQRNKIQLYSRQVFITDDVKDVVPEFLMLLHGVIDSPDIPLNISRSFLQTDASVRKINSHITKKVADKLKELFNNDRKAFEEKWDDIGLFVKYGIISDEKFYDRAGKICLYKSVNGDFYTADEYQEKVKDLQTDKDDTLVIPYASDPATQDTYIASAENKGYTVLVFDGPVDNHFIQQMESKLEKVNFKRVDADTADKLIDKDEKVELSLTEEETNKVKEVFENVAGKESNTVTVEALDSKEMPVSIYLPEFMRRMKDMSATMGMGASNFPDQYTVAVNGNHPIIRKILDAKEDQQKVLAKQSYDLALLSLGQLKGRPLTDFIKRSLEMAEN